MVDREKDEVINMFNGKMAEKVYRLLSEVDLSDVSLEYNAVL